jgi:uncharacterized protein (DUF433 family)
MDHRVIVCNPKVLGGAPVFAGTGVPIQTLIDYWQGGLPLYEFLIDFPAVKKSQARHVLEWFARMKSSGKDVPTELHAFQQEHATAVKPDSR